MRRTTARSTRSPGAEEGEAASLVVRGARARSRARRFLRAARPSTRDSIDDELVHDELGLRGLSDRRRAPRDLQRHRLHFQ
jgi:hypothetical protein